MKKTLYIMPRLGVGGVETLAQIHLRFLSSCCVVHFWPLEYSESSKLKEPVIPYYPPTNRINSQTYIDIIAQKYDVVIWNATFISDLSEKFRNLSVPPRQVFVTHSEIAWFNSQIIKYFCKNDVICTVDNRTKEKLLSSTICRFDLFTREQLVQFRNRIDNESINVLPNCVQIEPKEHWTRIKHNKDLRRSIVFVARLEAPKMTFALIDAVCTVKNEIYLTIIGAGEQRQDAERLVKERDAQNVISFLGELPLEEVRRQIAIHDAFILVSASEGLPISVCEAMQLNTLVMCSDVGGIADVLIDGKTGLLIRSVDELTHENATCGSVANYNEQMRIAHENHAKCVDFVRTTIEKWLNMTEEQCRDMTDAARKIQEDRFRYLEEKIIKLVQ